MSNESAGMIPGTIPGTIPGGGLQQAGRVQLKLTPEIIALIKSELLESGLPDKIYKFTFDNEEYVFRPLYRKDWHEIQAFIRDNEQTITQDAIDCKTCQQVLIFPDTALHPVQWELQRAGLAASLSKFIMAKSGFFDRELDQSDMLRVETIGEVKRGTKPDEATKEKLKAGCPSWSGSLRLILVGDEYFVVRPLTRGEWKGVQSGENPDIDLATVERCTIWSSNYPEKPDFDDKIAGTVRSISEVIMAISGFAAPPQVEEL